LENSSTFNSEFAEITEEIQVNLKLCGLCVLCVKYPGSLRVFCVFRGFKKSGQ